MENRHHDKYIMAELICTRTGDKGGLIKHYLCSLSGEDVGEIIWREIRPYAWQKPYTVYVNYVDERTFGHSKFQRRSEIGNYDTLIECKRALLDPAKAYLEAKHEAEAKKNRQNTFTPAAYLPAGETQFYPTPSDVAGKLLSGVDWRKVRTILEPSAGRGDLLEFAMKRNKNGFRGYSYQDLDDIDCIEIDPNLQAMLIGKGFRVVHDDFLSYYTRKRYDLILMNPPFADGDAHLLKALELCESGGQIACILNAETIRNPYTNSRKALIKELRRRGASIRYLSNAFAHAARRARVDVALININIPKSLQDDTLWEGLKKAREERFEYFGMQEVAPANQVERLIREYDILCEAGIDLMKKYNGVKPHIYNGKGEYSAPIIKLKVGDYDFSGSSEDVNRFLRIARGRYWRELFDLPELRERMTSQMRKDYGSLIGDMWDYEFSMFNVQQVLEKIRAQLCSGVEEAIVKCFDKLSNEHAYHKDIANDNIHYYNGWKTNKAHCVNQKCIIPTWGCFAKRFKPDKHGHYRDVPEDIDARGCFSVLDDLEKALNYLDKGETGSVDLFSSLQSAATCGKSSNIVCKYFSVTFYKKGTCHIKFHDQKIVDRLNIYVGRQRSWLPPSYGSVSYQEMDEESRRVVDEFQGREKYEEIMHCPNDYMIETNAMPLLTA